MHVPCTDCQNISVVLSFHLDVVQLEEELNENKERERKLEEQVGMSF